MATDRVINLKGRKPQVVPEGAVYIGRRMKRGGWDLPESKWHSPFHIDKGLTRDEAIDKYREYLFSSGLIDDIDELRGKTLACWCAPLRCHGDLLVELLGGGALP